MKKVTKVFTVYRYEELPESAKTTALNYLINTYCDGYIFGYETKDELNGMFPNSKLDIEYDLSYSQGDYFNFYGELDLNDVLVQIRSQLTKKQIRLFKHIIKSWKDTHTISPKSYYCLNTAHNCNIFDGVIGDMEYYGYRDIPEKDIVAIADIAGKLLDDTCAKLMYTGYKHFYPTEEEFLEQWCMDDCYFTIDGNPYYD